jgi:palmitoyl-protein thioesterase
VLIIRSQSPDTLNLIVLMKMEIFSRKSLVSWLVIVLLGPTVALAYKPVVLIHGILTGGDSMLLIEEEIMRVRIMVTNVCQLFNFSLLQHHRGTKVYNTHRFAGWSSLDNAWYQVNELRNDLMEICKEHPEGVHLIGYSQGGLLARAILQSFPEHNVKNFISLSSPQAGQYGSE